MSKRVEQLQAIWDLEPFRRTKENAGKGFYIWEFYRNERRGESSFVIAFWKLKQEIELYRQTITNWANCYATLFDKYTDLIKKTENKGS